MPEMKYVVSVSGGAGSTLAAHRCVQRHGAENTVLVFADTNCEDPTLYAALEHMRESALPECDFVWLDNDGRTIWDVFNSEGIIKVNGGCKASLELKRKPLDAFVGEHWQPGQCVLVSGLDWQEPERIERFNRAMAPYETWHPMADDPVLSYCRQIDEMKRLGYPQQELYDRGYPHNNCGGGCVLAGQAQWAGLLKDNPALYGHHEQQEVAFNLRQTAKGHEPFTILRDRRDGGNRPMPLSEFRERVQSGDASHRNDFRSTCGCMIPSLFEEQPNE